MGAQTFSSNCCRRADEDDLIEVGEDFKPSDNYFVKQIGENQMDKKICNEITKEYSQSQVFFFKY